MTSEWVNGEWPGSSRDGFGLVRVNQSDQSELDGFLSFLSGWVHRLTKRSAPRAVGSMIPGSAFFWFMGRPMPTWWRVSSKKYWGIRIGSRSCALVQPRFFGKALRNFHKLHPLGRSIRSNADGRTEG